MAKLTELTDLEKEVNQFRYKICKECPQLPTCYIEDVNKCSTFVAVLGEYFKGGYVSKEAFKSIILGGK